MTINELKEKILGNRKNIAEQLNALESEPKAHKRAKSRWVKERYIGGAMALTWVLDLIEQEGSRIITSTGMDN